MSTAMTLSMLPLSDENERLGDEIARLSAEVDVAISRLLTVIREFDDRKAWSRGFRSCGDWLAWRVGLDPGAARERVRVARALGELPLLAKALDHGELSYSKVRALTRVATRHTEPRLLAIARTVTAAQVERFVRGCREEDRGTALKTARGRHESRTLHVHHDEHGMVVIRGRLDPEGGALFMKALEAAQDALYRRSRRAPGSLVPPAAPAFPQQCADALVLIAEAALHQQLDPGAPGERYQVVVHVEASESRLDTGTHVSAETSERLSCDASRTVMRHDAEGRVIEVEARSRTIPPALRRALLHRDQVCRFPGCGLRFVQAHHIQHWAQGGHTALSNLVLLCRYHHRAVHEEGYRVTRGEDGTLTFHDPDGQLLPNAP